MTVLSVIMRKSPNMHTPDAISAVSLAFSSANEGLLKSANVKWHRTGVMLFECIRFGDTEVGLTIFLTGASHRQVSTLITPWDCRTPGFRIQISLGRNRGWFGAFFLRACMSHPVCQSLWIFSMEVYYTQCHFIHIFLIVFVNILN